MPKGVSRIAHVVKATLERAWKSKAAKAATNTPQRELKALLLLIS